MTFYIVCKDKLTEAKAIEAMVAEFGLEYGFTAIPSICLLEVEKIRKAFNYHHVVAIDTKLNPTATVLFGDK